MFQYDADAIIASLLADTPVQQRNVVQMGQLPTLAGAILPEQQKQPVALSAEQQKPKHIPTPEEVYYMQDKITNELEAAKRAAHEQNIKAAVATEGKRFNVRHPLMAAFARGALGSYGIPAGPGLSLVTQDDFNANVAHRTKASDDAFLVPMDMQQTLNTIKLIQDPTTREALARQGFAEILPSTIGAANDKTVAGASSAKSTAPKLDPVTVDPNALLGDGGTLIVPTEPTGKGVNNPVAGHRITSPFGPTKGRVHNGIDVATPDGTPFKLDQTVKVVKTWFDKNGGHQMQVKLPDGTTLGFAHMKKKSDYAPGSELPPGTVFGYSGGKPGPESGHSTGPHTHLTVRNAQGQLVDPQKYFAASGKNTGLIGSSGAPISPTSGKAKPVGLPQAPALSAQPVTVPGVTPTDVPIAMTDPNRFADISNSVQERLGYPLSTDQQLALLNQINKMSAEDVALQTAQQGLQTEVNTAPLDAVVKQTTATQNTLTPYATVAEAIRSQEAAAIKAENDRLNRLQDESKQLEQTRQFNTGLAATNARHQETITAADRRASEEARRSTVKTYNTQQIKNVDDKITTILATVPKGKKPTDTQLEILNGLMLQKDMLTKAMLKGQSLGGETPQTGGPNKPKITGLF